jgi:hypothetical protein
MAINSTTAEDRLAMFGIHLPDAPTPFGAYELRPLHRRAALFASVPRHLLRVDAVGVEPLLHFGLLAVG